jgi:tRNA threonylcarbamoyladenosine biosynthesis protein TsaB
MSSPFSSSPPSAAAPYRRVLALETSSSLGGVALLEGEQVRGAASTWMAGAHSRRLLSDLDELLRREGLRVEELDLLVVSLGPGSFTGLRIGLATVKGLSLASGVPIAGASSLLTLASAVEACEGLVAPTLDARKGEVYSTLLRMRSGRAETVLAEQAVDPSAWAARVAAAAGSEPVLWLGTGALLYRELLLPPCPAGSRLAGRACDSPQAVHLAFLGREQALRCGPADLARLEPNYLRALDAAPPLSHAPRAGDR